MLRCRYAPRPLCLVDSVPLTGSRLCQKPGSCVQALHGMRSLWWSWFASLTLFSFSSFLPLLYSLLLYLLLPPFLLYLNCLLLVHVLPKLPQLLRVPLQAHSIIVLLPTLHYSIPAISEYLFMCSSHFNLFLCASRLFEYLIKSIYKSNIVNLLYILQLKWSI